MAHGAVVPSRGGAVKFTIGHLFAGVGGGALGAAAAKVRIGDAEASFTTLGGVDVDAESCKDFEYLVDAPCCNDDLHTMQPDALRKAWGPKAPDMVLLSPPCKGFSALLSKKKAGDAKYQMLNRLVLEGLFLVCSTWEKPPAIIFLENVPRITCRGRELLEQARQLLRAHGFVVTKDDYHDCGELGGLAQHRRRFFLVARDPERVPQLIYQPGKLRVRGCGEVIGNLPTPGDEDGGGPLHRLPKISWLNWVRLALIPAGGDWRDLPGVVPEGKQRRDVHRRHAVTKWDDPSRCVTGPGGASAENVADPRLAEAVGLKQTAAGAGSFKGRPGLMGVNHWEDPLPTVTGSATVSGSNAVAAVADPRVALGDNPGRHHNKYNVVNWNEPAKTVIGATRPGSGAPAVADPRWYKGVYGVKHWGSPSATVTGGAAPSRGAFAVADPRLNCTPRSGAYGVLSWQEAASTVTGSLNIDNSRAAVADPRLPHGAMIITNALPEGIPENPKRPPDFIPVIVAADGTWHRPLTTLELAALQGFPTTHKGKPLQLTGRSTVAWRERIGNAIPPPAAQAVASEMLLALLNSALGAFQLRSEEIWVKDADVDAEYFLAGEARMR